MRLYDVVMTHQLDADDLFIHRVQRGCAEARLNFFLIEPLWAEAYMQHLVLGRVGARVLLNMHSEHHQPEDLFHRLVRLSAEKGTQVVDPPDLALAAFDKAALHPKLVGAGLRVPETLFVRREDAASFRLTEADRALLGTPFVVKPNLGYGRRGLVLDATSEADIARSAAAWANPVYLLQRRVQPRSDGVDPAYFRVYFVFGRVWVAWWNCFTDRYRLVTPEEWERLQLARLDGAIRRVAALTGMNFFSSEMALTQEDDLVLIDYVNDQCHLLAQSANPAIGVPDEIVSGIAQALVDAAARLIRK